MKWFRLESETPKAFGAFCVFVVMHPSPLDAVAKAIGARTSTLSIWCNRHDWIKRKEAFLDANFAQKPQDMHLRHIQEAIALQAKALQKFQAIDPENLTNSEVIRFLTAGANLERAARRAFEGEKPQDDSQDDLSEFEAFFNE